MLVCCLAPRAAWRTSSSAVPDCSPACSLMVLLKVGFVCSIDAICAQNGTWAPSSHAFEWACCPGTGPPGADVPSWLQLRAS